MWHNALYDFEIVKDYIQVNIVYSRYPGMVVLV